MNTHTSIDCYCIRCGNTWSAKPYSLLQGHGCPRCAKSGTSFMEQFILKSFQALLGDKKVLSRDRKAIGKELDIFIPELKFAIEPGNWFLHSKRIENDKDKRKIATNMGIRLIFIYDNVPNDVKSPFKNDCLIYHEDLNFSNHDIIINLVCKLFEIAKLRFNSQSLDWNNIEKLAYECSKSTTHVDFIDKLREVHPNIICLGNYKNANKRLKVKCNKCGRIWNAIPASLIAGDGCWACARKNIGKRQRMPFDEFIMKVHRNFPNINIDKKSYAGTHSQVKATCDTCGNTWMVTGRLLIKDNPVSCKVCQSERRRKIREQKYLSQLITEKPHIQCLEPYRTKEFKLKHKCLICGYVWKTTPACVLSSKYACPRWKEHQKR